MYRNIRGRSQRSDFFTKREIDVENFEIIFGFDKSWFEINLELPLVKTTLLSSSSKYMLVVS